MPWSPGIISLPAAHCPTAGCCCARVWSAHLASHERQRPGILAQVQGALGVWRRRSESKERRLGPVVAFQDAWVRARSERAPSRPPCGRAAALQQRLQAPSRLPTHLHDVELEGLLAQGAVHEAGEEGVGQHAPAGAKAPAALFWSRCPQTRGDQSDWSCGGMQGGIAVLGAAAEHAVHQGRCPAGGACGGCRWHAATGGTWMDRMGA